MPSGMTRPPIDCKECGQRHLMSPAAMAAVIVGFMNGIMQTVGSDGDLRPKCLLEALNYPELTQPYAYRFINVRTEATPVEVEV